MDKDSLVHLIFDDPSDLGSLILIWFITKECTLSKECYWSPYVWYSRQSWILDSTQWNPDSRY